jgi:hypothetical protein
MRDRLSDLSRQQLVDSLAALAGLQLTPVDTQVGCVDRVRSGRGRTAGLPSDVEGLTITRAAFHKPHAQGLRATAAQSAPTPEAFTAALLQHLSPQLPGPDGASAAQLASVLQSLVQLGGSGVDCAWLGAALEGATDKLSAAVAAGQGGEQVLVDLLAALGRMTARVPAAALQQELSPLLQAARAQTKAALGRLDAVQIAAAMAALRQLQLDPDDSLMLGYLQRAADAAACGAASASDMGAVLGSIASSGVVPPPDWYQRYMAAVQQQLAAADSDSLAAITHAAAELSVAAAAGSNTTGRSASSASSSSSSGSSTYQLPAALVSQLVDVATARIGGHFMDAARILSSPDYKAPLSLQGLAASAWGLLKLGAEPGAVQALVSMLISKSYDRLTSLSGAQLAKAAWAIACCSAPLSAAASSSGGSRNGSGSSGSSASIKLPSKWLNQLAVAAADGVNTLTPPQLSDLIWALGGLYLSAEQYSTGGTDAGSSSSGGTGAGAGAGSGIGSSSSSSEPVQQLLRAVSSRLAAQEEEPQEGSSTPSTADVSTLVNLLARFDCPATGRLLSRFCADLAADWTQASDAALVDAAVALALLVGPRAASPSSGVTQEWLAQLAEQVQARLASLSPQQRSRCLWALATLQHYPGQPWLAAFAAATFASPAITELRPGDYADALWALCTLEALGAAQQRADTASSLLTLPLLQQLDRKLAKRVQELSPAQVLRLLALADGGAAAVPEWALPRGVAEQMSAVLSARAAGISDVPGLLAFAWAAASLDLPLHGSATDHICRKLYSQMQRLTAADMVRAFWASAKLRYG